MLYKNAELRPAVIYEPIVTPSSMFIETITSTPHGRLQFSILIQHAGQCDTAFAFKSCSNGCHSYEHDALFSILHFESGGISSHKNNRPSVLIRRP